MAARRTRGPAVKQSGQARERRLDRLIEIVERTGHLEGAEAGLILGLSRGDRAGWKSRRCDQTARDPGLSEPRECRPQWMQVRLPRALSPGRVVNL